jgi:hypothetical protein
LLALFDRREYCFGFDKSSSDLGHVFSDFVNAFSKSCGSLLHHTSDLSYVISTVRHVLVGKVDRELSQFRSGADWESDSRTVER